MITDTHVLAKGMTSYPPLPEGLPEESRRKAGKPVLNDGCYFIAYGLLFDAESFPTHVGTLRVDSRLGGPAASADLYGLPSEGDEALGSVPPRNEGIPIFPIADYRLYLRITKIDASQEAGFTIEFEAHRFIAKSFQTLDGATSAQWILEGAFKATMRPANAPSGYPKPELFFVGDVARAAADLDSAPIGRLQMGWVSDSLRRGVVEIDRVVDAKVPLDNGAGQTWQSVFATIGWEMRAVVSDEGVFKTAAGVWTAADVERARRKYRDSADLDVEWRYYLLVASEISAPGSKFGFMYHDAREALYITSQLVFPDTEAKWGTLRGKRFDDTVAFFRTAVHELGHAMGLGHNAGGTHFMNTTESIASAATDGSFPANVTWSFSPDDEFRLRHWPDIVVRPGGARLGAGGPLLPDQQSA
jgi:predicted Zn-dependent protease